MGGEPAGCRKCGCRGAQQRRFSLKRHRGAIDGRCAECRVKTRLLAGAVTFTIDHTPRIIGPGETHFIPRSVVHGFGNLSGAPPTCLCVLTPGVLGPEYFRRIAALVAAGPPDPEIRLWRSQRH